VGWPEQLGIPPTGPTLGRFAHDGPRKRVGGGQRHTVGAGPFEKPFRWDLLGVDRRKYPRLANDLRQNSSFAGILGEPERRRILSEIKWCQADDGRSSDHAFSRGAGLPVESGQWCSR
jgi:hypothetical protein